MTTPTRPTATRQGSVSGWFIAVVAVVVTAMIQALLAQVSTDPGWSAALVGLVLVSFADAALGLWLVASAIATTVRRSQASSVKGLVWTVLLLLVVVAAGVVVPWAVPVVVVPVAWLLAAVALGERHTVRAAIRALRASRAGTCWSYSSPSCWPLSGGWSRCSWVSSFPGSSAPPRPGCGSA